MVTTVTPCGALTGAGFADINFSSLDLALIARRSSIGGPLSYWWDPRVEFDGPGTGAGAVADRLASRMLTCGNASYPVDMVPSPSDGTFGNRPAFGLRQGAYLRDAAGSLGAADFTVIVPFRPSATAYRAVIGCGNAASDFLMYTNVNKLDLRVGGVQSVSAGTFAVGATQVIVLGYTDALKRGTVRANGAQVCQATGTIEWADSNLLVGAYGTGSGVSDGTTAADPARFGVVTVWPGIDLTAAANAAILAEVETAYRTHYGV